MVDEGAMTSVQYYNEEMEGKTKKTASEDVKPKIIIKKSASTYHCPDRQGAVARQYYAEILYTFLFLKRMTHQMMSHSFYGNSLQSNNLM